MELRQIFDTDLLLHLENVVFHSGVTWCFNSSGSHYDENIGGKFECFACPFYNLENHFDRYKEIEDACIKMHEERNTKWSNLWKYKIWEMV